MTNTEFVAFNEQLKNTELVKKTKSKFCLDLIFLQFYFMFLILLTL